MHYLPKLAILALVLLPSEAFSAAKPIRLAATCFGKGEQVSGMNKICYYDCLGSLTAITISSVALCPLTIDR